RPRHLPPECSLFGAVRSMKCAEELFLCNSFGPSAAYRRSKRYLRAGGNLPPFYTPKPARPEDSFHSTPPYTPPNESASGNNRRNLLREQKLIHCAPRTGGVNESRGVAPRPSPPAIVSQSPRNRRRRPSSDCSRACRRVNLRKLSICPRSSG